MANTNQRRPVPSYRLHKQSGQARVTLSGKDFYLGPYGSPASHRAYAKLIDAWEQGGRSEPPAVERPQGLRVNDLIHLYLDHVEAQHSGTDPASKNALVRIKLALRPLMEECGNLPADQFGPRALKGVRDRVLATDVTRGVVNERVWRIKRVFQWAVEQELVPLNLFHGLQAVRSLRLGEFGSREGKKVRPVSWTDVEAVLPHIAPEVQAIALLQWWTGARPGEIVTMRGCDIDRSGSVWLYRPRSHKTSHHGKDRLIPFGPRAQNVLAPFLKLDPNAYLFSPESGDRKRRQKRHLTRRTQPTPSQIDRDRQRREHPLRGFGSFYSVASYRQAIRRACTAAGIKSWTPHQLRHSAATRLRREGGIEAARVILGHTSAQVTEIYAEIDRSKAEEIMRRLG